MNPEAELTRLYHADYARLVRTLGVAFDPRDAADAVQEAYWVCQPVLAPAWHGGFEGSSLHPSMIEGVRCRHEPGGSGLCR